MPDGRQTNRVTLVTGASRGIGRAVALGVAREGGHVIALARTQGALEELDDAIRGLGGAASLIVADVADGDAVDRLAPALAERWGRLDGLVGNAAVLGPLSPLSHIAPKDWDQVLAVNVTANFRLLRALDFLLRKSPAGRAVFVTSRAADKPRAYWAAYAASKGALNALVSAYAAEMDKTPVRANLYDPGATRTAMRAKAMPGEDPAGLPAPEDAVAAILDMLDPAWTKNGERVVQRELRAASA